MREPFAYDTETGLIRPACYAPPVACLTYARRNSTPGIVDRSQAGVLFRGVLEDESLIIVGHNVAYDMAVMMESYPDLRDLIFAAYDADRVTCIQIRQQLLDIANGTYQRQISAKGMLRKREYSLEALARRCAGMELKKDEWRLSYGEFLNTPLDRWVERAREVQEQTRKRLAGAIEGELTDEQIAGMRSMIEGDPSRVLEYPIDDARATLAVFESQEVHAKFLEDQFRQARWAFAGHLESAWGLKTDRKGVEILREQITQDYETTERDLVVAGLVRANGTRDTKKAKAHMVQVCKASGFPIVRTDAHFREDAKCGGADECDEHVCLDGDACEASEDDLLAKYAELTTLKKVLSNDIEALQKGTFYPIHTRYGLAATGRVTSSKPNIQNWVRERVCNQCDAQGRFPGIDDGKWLVCEKCGGTGKLASARQCFIPRPGHFFIEADYPQLELYALAQCCVSWLGKSDLGDALNAGLDPHMKMTSIILNTTYEECVKNKNTKEVKTARGSSKVANFGFPGGLGVDSLIDYAKKAYGQVLTRDQAKQLKEYYFATWTEMPAYFARVNALCDNDSNRAMVETLWTKRFRGNATYCAACNNGFQALGADIAKRAGWALARACYTERKSPLFNCRPVVMAHDEYLSEAREEIAHEAAYEQARIMVVEANVYLPDVPISMKKMEPVIMRRWHKDAVSTFDNNGRLIPWEDRKAA